MEIKKYVCDVCKNELNSKEQGVGFNEKIQVIFTTDQEEGRLTNKNYFDSVYIDWCSDCRNRALSGNYLFAVGAMGNNEYYFVNKQF